MTAHLNADDLIRGEMYALEQAGHLLHDAVSLFDRQRYSSAVVLGVFCREELGRARIYSELRKQVRKSGPVTLEDVQRRGSNHIEKLRQGLGSTPICFTPGKDELFDALFKPEHPKFREARRMLDQVTQKTRKRDPQLTHERRKRGLYVEPIEDGIGWNRPRYFKREEAHLVLEHVANDYSSRFDQLRYADKERYNALHLWKDRPELPEPVWPKPMPPE